MTRPRILVTARFDSGLAKKLEARADVLLRDWWSSRKRLEPAELAAALKGCQLFVTEVDQVSDSLLSACPDLKVVITCRGNPVNLDIPACTRRGVLALHTPGRNAEAVADLTLAFILACARHVVAAAALIRQGGWTKSGQGGVYFRFQGLDMDAATVGLVGLGAVGRAVSRRLQPFGSRVLAYDPYIAADAARKAGAIAVDLPTLLKGSDFVSLHVHVTPQTAGMIGEGQFALMRPTAYLINTARAGAVDQPAMLRALKERRIAGAALDVFSEEPLPENDPLRALENVILTPHIGGATPGIARVQSATVVEQVEALLSGRRPAHMLNPETAGGALEALKRS